MRVERMYREGRIRDPITFSGACTCPEGQVFLHGTTYHNLLLFIKLYKLHPRLAELWLHLIRGKHDNKSLNVQLGADLEHLVSIAEHFTLRSEEIDRLRVIHRMSPVLVCPRRCPNEIQGRCHLGPNCPYLHG